MAFWQGPGLLNFPVAQQVFAPQAQSPDLVRKQVQP